jgi:hypothetical protein
MLLHNSKSYISLWHCPLPPRLTGKAFMKVCECICGQNVGLERIGWRGNKYVVIKLFKQRSAFPNTHSHTKQVIKGVEEWPDASSNSPPTPPLGLLIKKAKYISKKIIFDNYFNSNIFSSATIFPQMHFYQMNSSKNTLLRNAP